MEEQEEEEEGGGGGGVDEKMKGTGGEVKENSRLEERGWNRNVWREWRLNSGRWAGGFLLLFTVHVNLFFSSVLILNLSLSPPTLMTYPAAST